MEVRSNVKVIELPLYLNSFKDIVTISSVTVQSLFN